MPHIITPIKIVLPTGYDETFVKSTAGPPHTATIVTTDQTDCCGHYSGTAGARMAELVFAQTNQSAIKTAGPFHGSPPPLTFPVLDASLGDDMTLNVLGAIKFGVCCATSITIAVEGAIAEYISGRDSIKIYYNGGLVYSHASTGGAAPTPYDEHRTVYYYEEVTIPLDTEPCGDIILIEADTVVAPRHATYPAVPDRLPAWDVTIVSIS